MSPPDKEMSIWSKLTKSPHHSKGQRGTNKKQQDCEVKKVPLDKHLPDRQVTISAALEPEEECELLEFLNKNKDVFAWSASDLRSVSRDIIEHKLDIDPKIKAQKNKNFARCLMTRSQ